MISKTLLVTNIEEIEEAEQSGYSIDEEREFLDFWFTSDDITLALSNYAGNINIKIDGEYFTIPDNKEIRDMLNKRFK